MLGHSEICISNYLFTHPMFRKLGGLDVMPSNFGENDIVGTSGPIEAARDCCGRFGSVTKLEDTIRSTVRQLSL